MATSIRVVEAMRVIQPFASMCLLSQPGRYRAELGVRALRKLLRVVNGKRKDPELSARFGHLAD
jgi:hypothetical protein